MAQSSAVKVGSSLARRAPQAIWQAPDWQRLWLSTQQNKRSWRSLALVPAGDGAPPTFMMQVAVALSHTGMSHLGGQVHVADATDIELDQLVPFREELERTLRGPDRVLIALPPLASSVTALPLAQLADACLLCVLQGVSSTRDVKQTVESLGSPRILGAAMFRGMR